MTWQSGLAPTWPSPTSLWSMSTWSGFLQHLVATRSRMSRRTTMVVTYGNGSLWLLWPHLAPLWSLKIVESFWLQKMNPSSILVESWLCVPLWRGGVPLRLLGRPTKLWACFERSVGENAFCWENDGCVGHCGPDYWRTVVSCRGILWPTMWTHQGPGNGDPKGSSGLGWTGCPSRSRREVIPTSIWRNGVSLQRRMPNEMSHLSSRRWQPLAFVPQVQLTFKPGAGHWPRDSYDWESCLSTLRIRLDDAVHSWQRWTVSCYCHWRLPECLRADAWYMVVGFAFTPFHRCGFHSMNSCVQDAFPIRIYLGSRVGSFDPIVAALATWKGRDLAMVWWTSCVIALAAWFQHWLLHTWTNKPVPHLVLFAQPSVLSMREQNAPKMNNTSYTVY